MSLRRLQEMMMLDLTTSEMTSELLAIGTGSAVLNDVGAGGRGGLRRSSRAGRLGQRYQALRRRHEDLLRQMSLAEQVQRSMLPQSMPDLPGVCFAAALRPTQHMAGDFYNITRLDRTRIGICVGDVMGHGPAAALLSVYAMQTIQMKRIEGHSYEIIEPGAVLARLNHELLAAAFPGMPFLTLVYGVLDLSRRTWTYCCGGHPHPLLLRPDRPAEALEPTAPLLGVVEAAFTQRTVSLQVGDRLVLYSDGVLAASWDSCSAGVGAAGLALRLNRRDGQSLQRLIDEAISEVRFHDGTDDDVAVLAVEITA